MNIFSVIGQFVDIPSQRIYPAEVVVKDGKIDAITKIDRAPDEFILPGFIDAHVHIESSMLVPSEFARLAVVHGTVATVSDPHEIANVCGLDGVEYMIDNGKQVNFKFYFGAPSCVPATSFETAGGKISAGNIDYLLAKKEIRYLAEMMNWPGTIHKDPEVMEKIEIAKKYGKPVDGHAPGLKGESAQKYCSAGITTDHECFTYEEALGKIELGMKIAIREGSAAKNFDALIDLVDDHADKIMFCSDDKHPDNLVEGHINSLVKRAVAKGKNIFSVLKAACINPVAHYNLDVGQLKIGDDADFILVKNLKEFSVLKTFVNGELVAENGETHIRSVKNKIINHFSPYKISVDQIQIPAKGSKVRVIEALDGQLITPQVTGNILVENGKAVSNIDADILKIVVVNRYEKKPPSVAFIRNFGLKEGAIASSVAHDSHNIIAVGVEDDSISKAIGFLMEVKGGISAYSKDQDILIPLPVAGLMSDKDGYSIAHAYTAIDKLAKNMGSKLQSPFMTLSFMALLVIPDLKLSDKGLFNGQQFTFVDLFLEEGQ